jgi:hypothetical protein
VGPRLEGGRGVEESTTRRWRRRSVSTKTEGGREEDEEDKEEGLFLRLETRERVQINEAKSKRRRASPEHIQELRIQEPSPEINSRLENTFARKSWAAETPPSV